MGTDVVSESDEEEVSSSLSQAVDRLADEFKEGEALPKSASLYSSYSSESTRAWNSIISKNHLSILLRTLISTPSKRAVKLAF